jgi:hypothetical protein
MAQSIQPEICIRRKNTEAQERPLTIQTFMTSMLNAMPG